MIDPTRQNPPQDETAPEAAYAKRAFRSVPGVISGVLLLAVAAWFGVDAIVHGSGRTPWTALAVLALVLPLIVAYTLRPAVYADNDRLLVRNPLRSITAPWAAVDDLRSGYSVELRAGGRKYQVWAVPVSLRQRSRADRTAARAKAQESFAGRGPAGGLGRPGAVPGAPDPTRAWSDQVVDVLRGMAERNADRPEAAGAVTTTWCWWVIAPFLAGLVALLALIATG